MRNQIDHIVEHLFHKKRLDDVSVYELERFIATHPYFAAGHFLLAKKNQLAKSDNFKEKIATAALYYHNPLWLQWLLDQDYNGSSKHHEATEPVSDQYASSRDEEIDETIISERHQHEKIVERPIEDAENDNFSHFYSAESSQPENSSTETISNVATSRVQEENVDASREDISNDVKTDISDLQPESQLEAQSDIPEQEIAPGIAAAEEIEIIHTGSEKVSESTTTGNFNQPEATAGEVDQSAESQFQHDPDIKNEFQQSEQQNTEDEESRASAAAIEKTLSGAALIPTKAEIEKTEFTFEPYHTIDYFASQGIKLQQSDLSKDKFGKQLKSFTEWLRSMKRLPQAATDGSLDEATQRSIQQIAEHSFEEKEIVTETMAEVWIKQGNKEKAIDTLNKLSLLNPSKSHYFAAKIEQLKSS
ncbi:MAG TPA: hypothetical protein VKA49_19240 [Flavitalea sp.]|nr:hypothetical protein [Flavitalea sp.]